MFHRLVLALSLLSLAFLVLGGPLEQREAAPGIIDDLIKGVLTEVGKLVKDVLSGAKSAIDNNKNNKPIICIPSIDVCCPCTLMPSYTP